MLINNLEKITITIPLKSSVITTDASILVETFTPTGKFKSQTTDFPKLQQWIGGLKSGGTGTANKSWIDLLAAPTPMLVGIGGVFTTMAIIRTWPKDHQWHDKAGGQKFAIPPVIIGGTWNTTTKKLTWSGIALVLDVPTVFRQDFLVVRWPFGNVYDDGHVCWGENSTGDLTSPAHIFTMANRFFDTPFNTDLRRSDWSIVEGKAVVNATQTLPFSLWVK